MSALLADMRQHARFLSAATIVRFEEQGISRASLLGLIAEGRMAIDDVTTLNPLSAARISIDGGLFDFDDGHDSVGACVFFGLNTRGEPVDIVAIVPRASTVVTLMGRCAVLGLEQLYGPRLEPLAIHDTALDWLRAERRGLFIVDIERAKHILASAGPFEVSSRKLQAQLTSHLTVRPRIVLTAPVATKAAERREVAA